MLRSEARKVTVGLASHWCVKVCCVNRLWFKPPAGSKALDRWMATLCYGWWHLYLPVRLCFSHTQWFCVFLSGAGIGSVFGSLVIGYARHPVLKQQLFSYAILGFALSEAMGLFCLMMAFLILFAF